MENNNSLRLLPGEIILYAIQSDKESRKLKRKMRMLFVFNFAYISMVSIFIYLFLTNRKSVHVNPESSVPQWIFIFIIPIFFGVLFIGGSLYYSGRAKNARNALYYLTSKRVVKYVERSYFSGKPKVHDISYDNLSHAWCWERSIEFVPKKITGQSHYDGKETKIRYPLLMWKSPITIPLEVTNLKEEKKQILQIMQNQGKLRPHPMNDDLYYQ